MPTQQKMDAVVELSELFRNSSLVMVAEYIGMNVKTLQAFRGALRETGASFRVAKGTLARIAADDSGREGLKQFVSGPVGFFSVPIDADPSVALKSLFSYVSQSRIDELLKVKGGILGSESLTADDVVTLSELPPLGELRGRFIGLLNAPASRLIGVIQGPARGLITLVNAYKEKMESAA